MNNRTDTNSDTVLRGLQVKHVSFNIPVTGEMKLSLKNICGNTLQVHKVVWSPRDRAPHSLFIKQEANVSDHADKVVERIISQ